MKTNRKRPLSDEELQQTTGGGEPFHFLAYNFCKDYKSKAACEKVEYCCWYGSKDEKQCVEKRSGEH